MATLKKFVEGKQMLYVKSGMCVYDVVKYMDGYDIGAVPVLDEENKLIGIFSERDLMRRCVAKEKNIKEIVVDEVMTNEVIFINSDDTPEKCLRILQQEQIRHIPVVEGNKLIGMISLRDLFLYDMQVKEHIVDTATAHIFYG